MRLFEYFESRENNKNPKDMSETEWLPVATLQVPSGKIVVCDVEMAGYPDMYALIIEVPVSDYLVEAKVADYGADARVSRLRAMMSEAEVRLGCIIGDTWTDTGKTGLGDYDACLALGSSLTSDEMNNFLKEQIAGQFRGIVVLEKRAHQYCHLSNLVSAMVRSLSMSWLLATGASELRLSSSSPGTRTPSSQRRQRGIMRICHQLRIDQHRRPK